jgi:uncharacterized paraquat-inducible protein A
MSLYSPPYSYTSLSESEEKVMAKAVIILGWVLLAAGVALILLGLFGLAMTDGLWAAVQMMSPFNIANFILTVVTLAPGMLLVTWGQKLKDR